MTVYNVVLFAHITSVIIMFAGVTADWLAVGGLRATREAGPARAWIRALEISAASSCRYTCILNTEMPAWPSRCHDKAHARSAVRCSHHL